MLGRPAGARLRRRSPAPDRDLAPLARARGTLERGHKLYRERYLVAASSLKERKRLGIGPRWLRSACGMLLDWLRICHRAGWLGTGPRRGAAAEPLPVPEIRHRRGRRRKAARGQRSRGRPPDPTAAGR